MQERDRASSDGQWRSVDRRVGSDVERVPFEALKAGDIFRLVNADGTLVDMRVPWMRCMAPPVPCEPEGNMMVTAEAYDERAERAAVLLTEPPPQVMGSSFDRVIVDDIEPEDVQG